jgi:kynureninase
MISLPGSVGVVKPSRDAAQQLDAGDPLAALRNEFTLPDGIIYLDGNSLGALGRRVADRVASAVTVEWGRHLVRAWNEDNWWATPLRVGDRVGAVLGAAPGQTVVGESTSVQIFNALTAAARMRDGRPVILTDPDHFPTDGYIADSVGRMLGLEVCRSPDPFEALRRRGPDVAVVAWPAVDYRTGRLWDMAGLTAAAHDAGAVVMWDVCHAVGAVPLHLDADGVDVAVGCSYKYLSGGPGAPAFIYVAARHQDGFDQPLTGWHGHTRPFAMEPAYEPAAGIARARIGSPQLLSMLALDAALDVYDLTSLDAIRAKSLALTELFIACADELLAGMGFDVVTPREPARRGSQVALRHPDAYPMMAALIDSGVIGDVRRPDLLRFGFNALYNSYTEVYDAVRRLAGLTASGAYRDPRFAVRKTVT